MSAQIEDGPLAAVLRDAATGRFPPANGDVTVLGAHTHREAHITDLLCVASHRSGRPGLALSPEPDVAHPRIARAMRYRDDVRAWRAEGGVVLIGRGVAARWEVAIEVDPGYRRHGLGRALTSAARHLVPGDGPLWAQIAPANAASVRAFLAAGFRPVGAEALLTQGELGV